MTRFFLIYISLLTIILPVWADIIEPEAFTGRQKSTASYAKHFMVASSHKKASAIGVQILKKGGNALDAAIAIQAALTLFEPQSSGIGGGAFLLYYDAKTNTIRAFDGRETAPALIDEQLFINTKGQPIAFCDAVVGGQSVGVPGVLKMLELAHQQHGKTKWAELFIPTIHYANQGFEVTPRLAGLLEISCAKQLKTMPDAKDYFFPAGKKIKAGEILKNPQLAQSLTIIAEQGANGLYRGTLAEKIASTVQAHGGTLQKSDLLDYEAIERPPVCFPYREYKICSMGPPSSGATTIAQLMMAADQYQFRDLDYKSPKLWHYYIEGAKLAYADRDTYIADSDVVDVPLYGLLEKDYRVTRLQPIKKNQVLQTPTPHGFPARDIETPTIQAPAIELASTSHIVVIDQEGNAVSMTSSIEHAFGSNLMVGGFLLNNQLTDFSFVSHQNGKKIANRVQPNKRPRSSMSPTIVLDQNGRVVMAMGSAGGSRIIHYVAQALIAMLDWEFDIQEAIEMPHLTNNNGVTYLEKGTWMERLKRPLIEMGHQVKVQPLTSGTTGIQRLPDGRYLGSVDPRREGEAVGE